MQAHIIIGLIIFILVFLLITFEFMNKTLAALLGASIYLLFSFIGQDLAFKGIDWNVIFLLISMMIIVGITKDTGLFQYVAIKLAKLSRGNGFVILILLSLVTAVFSAFLDNVTTVLILAPISILIAVELGLNPTPFVISEAIASNIGGTATLIGDPPNIMIGSAAHLGFSDFLVNLGPVILIMLVFFIGFIYLFWGRKMHVANDRKARIMDFDEKKSLQDNPLLIKSLIVLGLVITGFLLHATIGVEAATIALSGAALLMILSGRKEVEKFFHEVEWTTIFFFIGLFILVGGLEEMGIISAMSKGLLSWTGGDVKKTTMILLWGSGFLSAVVDNIPYVATMIPLIKDMGHSLHLGQQAMEPLWWALSLGACLGGNGTLIGASANVVSAGISEKNGHKISFLQFTKYGAIVTVVNLLIASVYLFVFYLK